MKKNIEQVGSLESKEPMLIDLFSEELERQFLENGKVYSRKIEPILGAEKVSISQVVETKLPDGTLESTQEAKDGDWIITGTKGEKFVFTDKKFQDLYDSDGKGEWLPKKRKIIAMSNPFGGFVRISAPWGTQENPAFQDGSDKCMFVVGLDKDGNLTQDRYIIGDEQMLLNNYSAEEAG
ncbi:MAG: hypothetical protein A2312_04200 [Candidatus Staskawiczbacteria bacterium RIFOXYB2_FULL_32_9]|uniref:Uncharacterized protein n=1 Tax=Candidatus Staskawiczbacteria bacterium RIFOXYD1_FULL_32_13 TaxID=1802234 RepID=A0A1G2JRE2_9BACT|nr:MAG: hypothetical protein UR22_C0020G0024 [Parcubacteria group bacterium GW2011_GWC2_32_10]OGZ77456.1 MAG: hypothetical protein A2256_00750 [Candidatus Staskawiczbacteria bacterium RIFOXYA2_FULL_32_7]OGZ80955.1 MAG: hypothetical protein A2360_01560 [Candidatus Staskawiczbacteria bacterium RIFOXYB1_FULL_32_11]OGZ84231.1 MAG: hypothetical protein A2312_04200 [Candidatus Staskawiczbacteria bacterium RIFOXYB2_FULL_32_9]OGZ87922.1 MAG: hypothetical protein A2463_00970 [Candidatus Staskawiczbacter